MVFGNQVIAPQTRSRTGRSRIATIAVAFVLALASLLTTVAPANAAESAAVPVATVQQRAAKVAPMSTGQYEYICQMPNGQSWSLRVGEKTSDCKGSYLQKYINGRMVANYALAYNGNGALASKPDLRMCIIGLSGVAYLLLFPPTGAVAWFLGGTLAGVGLKPCYAA